MAAGKTVVYRFSKHGNPSKPLLELPDGPLVRMSGPGFAENPEHPRPHTRQG